MMVGKDKMLVRVSSSGICDGGVCKLMIVVRVMVAVWKLRG